MVEIRASLISASQGATESGKISFLIPAYNHQNYIAATLDSIEKDDYPLREIVVIDDGSLDGTAHIIESWCRAHSEIEVKFRKRENRGVTATLNELIGMASGEYLRLFSSDDLLISGSTSLMAKYLDQRPELSAVFSDVSVIDSDGQLIAASALEMNGANTSRYACSRSMEKEIVSRWAVSGPAILIRASWYRDYGAYKEDMLIDDWHLYLSLVSRSALAFCNIKSAQYRRHDMNTCRTPVVEKRIENLKSQVQAADLNVGKFTGSLKTLLRGERALLLAKIQYLSRSYVQCLRYLVQYAILNTRGRI